MNVHSLSIKTMDNKREQILRAAENIIANEGLHNLSMQKLAKDAGVAAGTIYRYFTDKDELIDELRRDVLTQIAQSILEDADQGSIEERFRKVWFNIIRLGETCTLERLNFEQYTHLPGANSTEHRQFERETFAPLHTLFDEAKAEGLIVDLNDELLFALAFEPAVGLCRRMRRTGLNFSMDELSVVCDLSWRAIKR